MGAVRQNDLIEDIGDFDIGFQDNDGSARKWLNEQAHYIQRETGLVLKDYGSYVLRLFWPEDTDLTGGEREALGSTHKNKTMFVDLFPCQQVGRTILHGVPTHDFPAFMIDGTDIGRIRSYEFPIPRHARTVLSHRYGRDWAIPLSPREYDPIGPSLVVPFKERYTCYAQGVYDLFHVGHVNLLARAKKLFDVVIAGVDTDASIANLDWKNVPILTQQERLAVVEACQFVDKVLDNPSETVTLDFINRIEADYVVCGLEAPSKMEHLFKEVIAADRLHALTRTDGISTTEIRSRILKATQRHHPSPKPA